MTAERLNAKAAKENLSIRNSKNDLWKLDLHGLHAVEAVQALQERLQKLESLPLDRSASPDRKSRGGGIVRSASLEFLSCMETDKLDAQRASSQQRPTSLDVITGIMIILPCPPMHSNVILYLCHLCSCFCLFYLNVNTAAYEYLCIFVSWRERAGGAKIFTYISYLYHARNFFLIVFKLNTQLRKEIHPKLCKLNH